MTIFETKIIISNKKPFFTFLAKSRKKVNVNMGDILYFQISKDDKHDSFVGYIGEWGKVNVPIYVIRKLNLENHDIIDVKFLQKKMDIRIMQRENKIDLAKINGFYHIQVLERCDSLILWKKYSRKLIIPRFITIKPDFLKTLYLIVGDGHYKTKLSFTNKNFRNHNMVIGVFEKKLKIPKEVWKLRILHHETSNTHLMNSVKSYWLTKLNFKENQIYPTISYTKLKTNPMEIGRAHV